MKFGIELECYNVAMNTVVTALRGAGLNATISGYNGRDYDKWQVKSDGSILGVAAFELVSPVLHGEEGIREVRRAVEVLRLVNAKVNDSCGFHIHHDVRDFRIAEWRNLFKRFIKFEAAMDSVMTPKRRDNQNRYIGSMFVHGMSNKSAVNHAYMFQRIDECRSVNQIAAVYVNSRYLKLNAQSFFRCGTVEFRHHHGTVNADVIERYIRLTAGMVKQARDHVPCVVYKKDVDAKQSLELMMRMMMHHGYIGRDWGHALLARARNLRAREVANV